MVEISFDQCNEVVNIEDDGFEDQTEAIEPRILFGDEHADSESDVEAFQFGIDRRGNPWLNTTLGKYAKAKSLVSSNRCILIE